MNTQPDITETDELATVVRVHPSYKPPTPTLQKATKQQIQKAKSEGKLKLLADALREQNIRLARKNPNAFIEYVFKDDDGQPFVQAWFHREWQDAITEHDRVMIVGPRGHGKTSQVVGRVIWMLGNNPNLRIKIVCAADDKAMDRLFEVIQHIQYNPRVREVFPNLRPADVGSWTKHKIIVRRTAMHRDASFEALGIQSTATGGRADVIFADDVVDRRSALMFPKLREQAIVSWHSDWVQLLVPSGQIVYICTMWHKKDLSHQIKKNKRYHVHNYVVGDNFEAIWPEVWSTRQLQFKYEEIGPTEYARAYRGLVSDKNETIIKPDWVRFFNPKSAGEGLIFVTSYDAALGKGQEHSDFAACIFAVDTDAKKILLWDAYTSQADSPGQLRHIGADWERYKPDCVVIESVGGFEGTAQFVHEAYPQINVIKTKPMTDKIFRMNVAAPYVANGTVEFSTDFDYTQTKPDYESRESRGEKHVDVLIELFDFPLGEKKDLADAFSQGVNYIAKNLLGGRKELFIGVL